MHHLNAATVLNAKVKLTTNSFLRQHCSRHFANSANFSIFHDILSNSLIF